MTSCVISLAYSSISKISWAAFPGGWGGKYFLTACWPFCILMHSHYLFLSHPYIILLVDFHSLTIPWEWFTVYLHCTCSLFPFVGKILNWKVYKVVCYFLEHSLYKLALYVLMHGTFLQWGLSGTHHLNWVLNSNEYSKNINLNVSDFLREKFSQDSQKLICFCW